jgi:hypothetical protein
MAYKTPTLVIRNLVCNQIARSPPILFVENKDSNLNAFPSFGVSSIVLDLEGRVRNPYVQTSVSDALRCEG